MDLDLAGKHAIVTGGTRGIGRAVIERLLAEGMQVSFCARDADGVAQAAGELGAVGVVWGEPVDVADHAALTGWVEQAIRRAGGVDVVVPNASALGGIANDAGGWQRSFDVDVLPAVLLVESALPSLRERGGAIVQLGTITAVEYHHYPGGGMSYGAADTSPTVRGACANCLRIFRRIPP